MYVLHVHIQWARLYVCVHVNISTEMFRSIFRYECTNACLRVHRHMIKNLSMSHALVQMILRLCTP